MFVETVTHLCRHWLQSVSTVITDVVEWND